MTYQLSPKLSPAPPAAAPEAAGDRLPQNPRAGGQGTARPRCAAPTPILSGLAAATGAAAPSSPAPPPHPPPPPPGSPRRTGSTSIPRRRCPERWAHQWQGGCGDGARRPGGARRSERIGPGGGRRQPLPEEGHTPPAIRRPQAPPNQNRSLSFTVIARFPCENTSSRGFGGKLRGILLFLSVCSLARLRR